MELAHYYSLTPDWLSESVKRTKATLIHDKIIILPNKIAEGVAYFTTVAAGIAVVFMDAVFMKNVPLKCLESNHDLYILHFDLSDEISLVTLDKINYKKESGQFDSGFSVLHSSIENTFTPIIGQRTFALRLLVDKELMLRYINKKQKQAKDIEKKVLFYNHVNSNSKILVQSLREKSVFEPDFDSYIRGISLKLFANFIETYTNPAKNKLSSADIKAINITKKYMLDNLYESFPSITHLAKFAGMSETKYKTVFKKVYHLSPYQYYLQQKMKLANILLQSGAFCSYKEILQILNYTKYTYFSNAYYKYIGKNPLLDFKRKSNEK